MANTLMATTPALSMGIKVQVTRGRAHIMQRIGGYQHLYRTDEGRVVDETLTLKPEQTYQSTPGESVQGLVISTDNPVFLTLNTGTSEFRVQVVKMLVLDGLYTGFTMENQGLSVANCSINSIRVLPVVPGP